MGRELRPCLLNVLRLEQRPPDLPPRTPDATGSPKRLLVAVDTLPEAIHYHTTASYLCDYRVRNVEWEHPRMCGGIGELEDVREGVKFLEEILILVG